MSNSEVPSPNDLLLVERLVLDLSEPRFKERALNELRRRRETFNDLAVLLWYSFGTIAALIYEVLAVYPTMTPPTLSASASNRACNALALLQTVAAHPETRGPFLKAQIPLYVYPLLNTSVMSKAFEYVRLTSLGVVGALVKVTDPEVISFLLQSEVIPLCLQIMETGSELSKMVATFIVQQILLDDVGLWHVCSTPGRFFSVASVLATMVISLAEAEQPSTRVLKHVIRCYLRLTDHPRARVALHYSLPEVLKDDTFDNCLRDVPGAKQCLQQLLHNLYGWSVGGAPRPDPGHSTLECSGGSARQDPGPSTSGSARRAPHPVRGHLAGGSAGGSSQAGPSRP